MGRAEYLDDDLLYHRVSHHKLYHNPFAIIYPLT